MGSKKLTNPPPPHSTNEATDWRSRIDQDLLVHFDYCGTNKRL
jgi:hypothetical protein